MAFTETEKTKDPILRVVEPAWDSSLSDAQKARAAMAVHSASSDVCGARSNAAGIEEARGWLVNYLEVLGVDKAIAQQMGARFSVFESKNKNVEIVR